MPVKKKSRKRATRKNLSYRVRRRNPAAKKKRTRKKVAAGRHRPVVYKRGGKWYRSPNSSLFPESTRLNPRRRRKTRKKSTRRTAVSRRRRTYRRNPARKLQGMLFNRRAIIQGASLAAGFGGGALVMPVIVQFSPQAVKNQRRFLGIIHVLLGSVVISKSKRPVSKNMAMGVLASGIYDLVAQNIPQLGLRSLPDSSGMLLNLVGPKTTEVTQDAPDETTSGVGLSYQGNRASRMGLSYERPQRNLGLSYEGDDDMVNSIGCDTAFDGMLE